MFRSAAGDISRRERKVRAAQGTPLLKMEAAGDSGLRQKKTTAPTTATPCVAAWGKGEKVCVRDHQPMGDHWAVPAGGCKFM